jgi:serine/threonine protein kinase
MDVRVTVEEGSCLGQCYYVHEDGALTFGRSGHNDVVILDKQMSRRHLELRLQNGRAYVRDLDSANGTLVNGVPVSEVQVRTGDVIRAGRHALRVELVRHDEEDETETAAGRPSTTAVLPRRTVGRFRIDAVLGHGGMATVYKAWDSREDRTVALKVMQAERARDPEAVQRFLREAEAGKTLHHPHLVAVLETGTIRYTHYLCLEYINGRSAADRVEALGPLSWRRAAGLVRQVAAALVCLAEHRLVHRDIKPENILLQEGPAGTEPVAKLSDLGLSCCLATPQDQRQTRSEVGLGTPHYIPPEQIADARRADARSDLYALGGTFFHLLTGRPPFDADHLFELVRLVREEPVPPLAAARAEAPAWVEAMIQRLMAKDPADRYPDAASLLAELDKRLAAGDG